MRGLFHPFILSLSLIAGLVQVSFAQTAEQVVEPAVAPAVTIRLAGKGLIDRRTGHSIALTCDSEDCAIYQWIEFREATAPIRLGDAFTFNPELVSESVHLPRAKSIKEYLKSVNGDVIYSENRMTKNIASGIAGCAVVILFPPSLIAYAIGGAGIANTLVYGFRSEIRYDSKKTYSITNQNGWNWSARPKKVSHSLYTTYLRSIQLNNP